MIVKDGTAEEQARELPGDEERRQGILRSLSVTAPDRVRRNEVGLLTEILNTWKREYGKLTLNDLRNISLTQEIIYMYGVCMYLCVMSSIYADCQFSLLHQPGVTQEEGEHTALPVSFYQTENTIDYILHEK